MPQSSADSPAVWPILVDRCLCQQRTFVELLPKARAEGWDLTQLMRITGCGAACGLCRPYLRRMLADGDVTFDSLLPPEDP